MKTLLIVLLSVAAFAQDLPVSTRPLTPSLPIYPSPPDTFVLDDSRDAVLTSQSLEVVDTGGDLLVVCDQKGGKVSNCRMGEGVTLDRVMQVISDYAHWALN